MKQYTKIIKLNEKVVCLFEIGHIHCINHPPPTPPRKKKNYESCKNIIQKK